jgi:hypothetical protein
MVLVFDNKNTNVTSGESFRQCTSKGSLTFANIVFLHTHGKENGYHVGKTSNIQSS